MKGKIVFDIFDKDKNKKKTQNERDADEIKVTGAIITTDKKGGIKGKKTVTQTDVWSEGAEIKALEGATMEDRPRPKKTTGKFTNSKAKRVNWNNPINLAQGEQPKPKPVGTWGDEKKTATTTGTWGNEKKTVMKRREKTMIKGKLGGTRKRGSNRRYETEDQRRSQFGEYERGGRGEREEKKGKCEEKIGSAFGRR